MVNGVFALGAGSTSAFFDPHSRKVSTVGFKKIVKTMKKPWRTHFHRNEP